VNNEEPILDEAMDNLKEAAQRIRATQNRLRASGPVDHPDYFVEARRRSEQRSSG
jgi:hypothetical protein